jgi:hypothetical protein
MAKKNNTTKYLLIGAVVVAAYFFLNQGTPGATSATAAAGGAVSSDMQKVQQWIAGETNPVNQAAMSAFVATLSPTNLNYLAQYYDYVAGGYRVTPPQSVLNYIQNISDLGVGFHA